MATQGNPIYIRRGCCCCFSATATPLHVEREQMERLYNCREEALAFLQKEGFTQKDCRVRFFGAPLGEATVNPGREVYFRESDHIYCLLRETNEGVLLVQADNSVTGVKKAFEENGFDAKRISRRCAMRSLKRVHDNDQVSRRAQRIRKSWDVTRELGSAVHGWIETILTDPTECGVLRDAFLYQLLPASEEGDSYASLDEKGLFADPSDMDDEEYLSIPLGALVRHEFCRSSLLEYVPKFITTFFDMEGMIPLLSECYLSITTHKGSLLCGAVDLLCVDQRVAENDDVLHLVVVDWKCVARGAHDIGPLQNFRGECFKPPFNDLYVNRYNGYRLQLSAYQAMLERSSHDIEYEGRRFSRVRVTRLYAVVFPLDRGGPIPMQLEYLGDDKMDQFLEAANENAC